MAPGSFFTFIGEFNSWQEWTCQAF